MEKFGIFELLDALSALTEKEEGSSPRPETDESYLPPSYDGGKNAPPPPANAEKDALKNFLARHDAIAKKAEKKN